MIALSEEHRLPLAFKGGAFEWHGVEFPCLRTSRGLGKRGKCMSDGGGYLQNLKHWRNPEQVKRSMRLALVRAKPALDIAAPPNGTDLVIYYRSWEDGSRRLGAARRLVADR